MTVRPHPRDTKYTHRKPSRTGEEFVLAQLPTLKVCIVGSHVLDVAGGRSDGAGVLRADGYGGGAADPWWGTLPLHTHLCGQKKIKVTFV